MKNTGQTLRRCSGQASIILVLLAAMALVFFAATLNWGRVSQISNMTTMAAINGTTVMASSIASYGESQIQGLLKGRLVHCDTTSIFKAFIKWVVSVIIFVIVAIFAPCLLPVVITVLINTSGDLVRTVIIVPGQVAQWQKEQANLPLVDQFLEQGLSGAAMGLVSDRGKIADYFDMNTNGKFGPLSGDTINRFGFYYSERLMALRKLNTADLTYFLNGLSALRMGISEGCPDGPDSYGGEPHCNPCCQPLNDPDSNPPKRLRPEYCDTDPGVCGNPPYDLIYDSTYPDYKHGGSFLARFGLDAEISPFQAADAKGVFADMWAMEHIRDNGGTDAVQAPENYHVNNGECSNLTPDRGFLWKEGVDTMCSTTWPYDQCQQDCAQSPHDPMDDIVYKLKEFYGLSQSFLTNSDTMLAAHIDQWFPQVAPWVADCDGANVDDCGDGRQVAGILGRLDGNLADWWRISAGWINTRDSVCLLRHYNKMSLAKTFTGAWCVPPLAGDGGKPAGMSYDEAITMDTFLTTSWVDQDDNGQHGNLGGQWGSLDNVIACDVYNVELAQARFQRCAADLAALPDKPPPPEKCGDSVCDTTKENCDNCPRDCGCDIGLYCDAGTCSVPTYPPLPSDCEGAGISSGGDDWACRKSDVQQQIFKAVQDVWTQDDVCQGDAGNDAEIDDGKVDAQRKRLADLQNCQNAIRDIQCPTVEKSGSCDDLPRSHAGNEPPYGSKYAVPNTAFQAYVDWVNASVLAAGGQASEFAQRKIQLVGYKQNMRNINNAVGLGKGVLDKFFSGDEEAAKKDPDYKPPVANLIDVRKNFHLYIEKLPNFLVYGWQSPKDPRNPSVGQRWHMIRAEAMVPSKCPTGLCCPPGAAQCSPTDQLMQVDTYTKDFMDRTRCYELKNYQGRALMRVTRWDEDDRSNGGVKFNNKVTVWNFRFGKPGTDPGSAAGLDACRGLGLVRDAGSYTPTDNATLHNAFMLDLSQPNGLSSACWSAVDGLLSKGTKSTACVEYRDNGDPNHTHMTVKFVTCPGGAFYDDKTIGN